MTSWRWPCSACTAASASNAAIRSSGLSPIPTRMPLVNGILSSPAARIVSRRSAGSFVGEPWWATRSARVDSSMSPCEAVTPRSRARSSRLRAPRFVCGSRPRSSARSQHQTTYATKSSKPSARRRSLTPGTLSGRSPVRTSSSLTPRRAALSISRSTSSGSCRCGRWVANAQYLQCDTHERESESVTLREKVTRRRIRGSLCTAPRPPARRPRAAAARGGPRCHAGAAVARRLALAVLLAALGLVAAGGAGGGGGATDARPAPGLHRPPSAVDAGLYLALPRHYRGGAGLEPDGPPSAVDAGPSLALQRDYDGDEGLDMRVRKPASPADAVRRLLDGRAEVALLDIHDLARARDRGRDLVGVMALVQRPLAAVLAGPGVRRPRDLDGRRVATSGGRTDAAILAAGRPPRRGAPAPGEARPPPPRPGARGRVGARRRAPGAREPGRHPPARPPPEGARLPRRRLRRARLPGDRPLRHARDAPGRPQRRARRGERAATRLRGGARRPRVGGRRARRRGARPRPPDDAGRVRRRLPRLPRGRHALRGSRRRSASHLGAVGGAGAHRPPPARRRARLHPG